MDISFTFSDFKEDIGYWFCGLAIFVDQEKIRVSELKKNKWMQ